MYSGAVTEGAREQDQRDGGMSRRMLFLVARVAGWLIVSSYAAGTLACYFLTYSAGVRDDDAVLDDVQGRQQETDLEALNDELVGIVRETVQPAHVSLWLRPDTPVNGKQEDQPAI